MSGRAGVGIEVSTAAGVPAEATLADSVGKVALGVMTIEVSGRARAPLAMESAEVVSSNQWGSGDMEAEARAEGGRGE